MPLVKLKLLRTWSFCPCQVSVIESLPAFSATWSPSMLIPRPSFTPSSLPSCLWKHVASSLGRPQLTNDLAKEADAIMEVSTRAFSATGISGVHNPMSSTTVAMPKDLCFYHTKFGKEARKCNKGGCKLAYLIPSSTSISSSTALGNGQAGR